MQHASNILEVGTVHGAGGTAGNARRAVAVGLSWLPLVGLVALALWATPASWPAWAWMWLLALAFYAGCKGLTWAMARPSRAAWWQHAGYLLLWPGMDADTFLASASSAVPRPRVAEWVAAHAKLLLGLVLIFGVARWFYPAMPYVTGWIGMAGIAFLLHFGLFHILSCGWRAVGINAPPIMRWPVLATSVAEFWGRRWNTAFRDLTHRYLFKPLTPSFGPEGAIVAGFVVSGVIHDVVISLPAGGGFGQPALYFVLQGLALLGQRHLAIANRWFTAAALLIPAGLLFHEPFVVRIVVPFLKVLGAL